MSQEETTLLLDKALDRDLVLHSICPTQDIIACAYTDQIVCHRLHWQKLWTFQLTEFKTKVTALSWHPYAKSIAAGFSNGTLIVLDLETGVEQQKLALGQSIVAIQWAEISRKENAGPSIFSPKCESKRSDSEDSTILCVSMAQSMTLLSPKLTMLASCSVDRPEQSHAQDQILQTAVSCELDYLYMLWLNGKEAALYLSVVDISALGKARSEMSLALHVSEEAEQLQTDIEEAVSAVEKSWAEVHDSLFGLRSALKAELRDAGHDPQRDVDQLETLLVLGEASCANNVIPEFLSKLRDQGIKKAAKAIDSALSTISGEITKLQAWLSRLLVILGGLESTLGCGEYCNDLSIQGSTLQTCQQHCSSLVQASHQAFQGVLDYQVDMRRLFVWLLQLSRVEMAGDVELTRVPIDTTATLKALEHVQATDSWQKFFESVCCSSIPAEHDHDIIAAFDQQIGMLTQEAWYSNLSSMKSLLGQIASSIQRHSALSMRIVQSQALDSGPVLHSNLVLRQKAKDVKSKDVYVCFIDQTRVPRIASIKPDREGGHQITVLSIALPENESLVDMKGFQSEAFMVALTSHDTRQQGNQALRLLSMEDVFTSAKRMAKAVKIQSVTNTKNLKVQASSQHANLQVSGSRKVAVIAISPMHMCVYDLENCL